MENSVAQNDPIVSIFLPIIIMFIFSLVAHMLAKEKGRNVLLWTILGFIPVVNIFCMWFFVGAANLRLEEKIDQLLKSTEQ
jgi:hypothetical protein